MIGNFETILLNDFDENNLSPLNFYNCSNTTVNGSCILDVEERAFMSLVYAYSLFRIMITLIVCLYIFLKINKYMNNPQNKQILQNKSNITHPHVFEIHVYQKIIKIGVVFEVLMTIHNFVVWRGIQYYVSYQNSMFEHYYQPYLKPLQIPLKFSQNCLFDSQYYILFGRNQQNHNCNDGAQTLYFIIFYLLWVLFQTGQFF